jgi:hypothetical protein
MEHRQLGRTGVSVSKLCLGAMMFHLVEVVHQALGHRLAAVEEVVNELGALLLPLGLRHRVQCVRELLAAQTRGQDTVLLERSQLGPLGHLQDGMSSSAAPSGVSPGATTTSA